MLSRSDWEISVPIETSAADFSEVDTSSCKISEKSVSAAPVRNPGESITQLLEGNTHRLNYFGIGKVIGDNFAHFREVPSKPFFYPHGIRVELLVKVVE